MEEWKLEGFSSEEEFENYKKECAKTAEILSNLDLSQEPNNLKPNSVKANFVKQEKIRCELDYLRNRTKLLEGSLAFKELHESSNSIAEQFCRERDNAFVAYAAVSLELRELKEKFNLKVAEVALEYTNRIEELELEVARLNQHEKEHKQKIRDLIEKPFFRPIKEQ